MYEFLSLKVKCPVCNESLMDSGQLVDNESSIKLKVEIAGKKGNINLSSIYGSYNYLTELDLPINKLVKFSCPHCSAQITSETTCLSCDAPMVPFYLDMGGKVSICSRNGCKNHKVEFDDLSIALNKLYQDYGLAGNLEHKTSMPKQPAKDLKKTGNDDLETIESGTFLQAYCPHCKKSLIEDEMLKLKIKNGKTGYIMLSPYLNVFTTKSTIVLPEDKTIGNISCFHCDTSLVEKDHSCGKCNSPVARIAVGARSRLVDFYMCTKKGCKWHGLSKNDYYDIRLEDSMEW